jgi:O-antigen/teichoic acid export membrane protein
VSGVVTAGLSYVLQLAVGRLMTPASYSETQSLLGLYMMLSMPAVPLLLLITRRIVRESAFAKTSAGKRSDDTYALLRALLVRTAWAGLALLAITVVARQPLARALALGAPAALPLFALSVATNLFFLIAHAGLLGLFHWRAAAALPVALGAARFALSLLFVGIGYGVSGVFAAIALSNGICFVVAWWLAVRGLPRDGVYRPLQIDEVGLAAALNAAFWFLVHVDTVYVNRELPALATSGYAAAATLARPVVYFPNAVNQMLFPFLASVTTTGTRRVILGRMLAAAAIVVLAALAVTLTVPELILGATFGQAYLGVSGILATLVAVLAPYSLMNIVLYDALARHDLALGRVFVAIGAAGGLLLALTTPPLRGLFVILAGCASAATVVGLWRMRGTIAGPTTRSHEPSAQSRS